MSATSAPAGIDSTSDVPGTAGGETTPTPTPPPSSSPTPTPEPPSKGVGLGRRLLQLVVVAVVVALAWAIGQAGVFDRAVEAVAKLGPWALPAFIALHVVSGVLFVPTAIPNVAGGLLFGVWEGLAAGLVGLGGGATLAFISGGRWGATGCTGASRATPAFTA